MLEITASGLVTQRFLRGMSARHLDALAETALEVSTPETVLRNGVRVRQHAE